MDRRIELVISKMETDIAKAWGTPTLAAVVDLSPSRFRHLFKQEMGQSPAQYLKALRMQKAELMLRTTFVPVKQIVEQVGIGSINHFVNDFRKAHGLTPAAYRRAFGPSARRQDSAEKRS